MENLSFTFTDFNRLQQWASIVLKNNSVYNVGDSRLALKITILKKQLLKDRHAKYKKTISGNVSGKAKAKMRGRG